MIIVADNINPMSDKVQKAMNERDAAVIADIVKRCEAAGASLIDINPGRLSKRNRDAMSFLVGAAQDACECGLILDSPDIETIKIGLEACAKTPIISAVTIEQEKLESYVAAAKNAGAKLVALLTGENGMPPETTEEKIELALRIADYCGRAGLELSRLIFDPVIPHVSWTAWDKHLSACLETIRLISDGSIFGESAATMAGVSNLFSGSAASPENIRRKNEIIDNLSGAHLTYCLTRV